MSRTRSHQPYRARFNRQRRPRQVHDHREGPCDLPALEQWQQELKKERRAWLLHQRYRCSWQLPYEELATLCGCEVCTGQADRRIERRQTRRSAATEIRQELREHPQDPSGAIGA